MITAIFDPKAREEFLSAVQYYEDLQTGLGLSFRNITENSIQNTLKSPFRYRIIHSPFRRHLLPKFPYAIIYTIEPDHIRIIAIAHTKRKPSYWVERVDISTD